MSVKLAISVPDVNQQLLNYDLIRVFRSTTGAQGPFVEITAEVPEPARLTGTMVGPFASNYKMLTVRINRGPAQTVQIVGTDPMSATRVADSVVAQVVGLLGKDDGTGRLQIYTEGAGTDEILEVLGDPDTLTILGFTPGQYDVGEAGRVPLIEAITEYLFEDVAGTEDDYYTIDFINSTSGATSESSDPVKGVLVDTVAKQQADTESPRGLTLLRKASHVFRQGFFQEDMTGSGSGSCDIPLVPLDASRYPSFQVVDINGQIVSAGLATVDGTAGNYRVEFFCPADAPISNDDRRWRLEWFFIDEDNRQVHKVTEFDVRDPDITASEVRDLKLMAMACQEFRVFIRELKRPYSIRLDVMNAGNPDELIAENVLFPGSGSGNQTLLTETADSETFVYHYTIPIDLLRAGYTYQAVWQISETISTAPQFAFQIIEVPQPTILQFFPSLRMVIDKYQKRRELLQAYQDSDIYEYLLRGIEIVNGWHPLTSYTMTSLPSPLIPFWLLAGQLWGLNAQHLLETDLQFDFSGQTVTLNYDHTGNLDTAIQRATSFLADNLTKTKTPLFRRASGVGAFAGKPYRFNALHNFTYPISNFGSNDFLTLISNIGLL